MHDKLHALYAGAMRGRTLYVIPFSMGPLGSRSRRTGVQLTDSPYVVASMRIMTRMGRQVLDALGTSNNYVRCIHSVGAPLSEGKPDVPWPCNPAEIVIAHFPEERAIWSYGSGYAATRCSARSVSPCGSPRSWDATRVAGRAHGDPGPRVTRWRAHLRGRGVSERLWQDQLRDDDPAAGFDGWKVWTGRDDIAWIMPGKDGRLRAINPSGLLRGRAGTSAESTRTAMHAVASDTIFTNVALTDDGDVWWEGMTREPPAHLVDWRGEDWTPPAGAPPPTPTPGSRPPSRAVRRLDPRWDDPRGVSISGFIFGGRMSRDMPLVFQAFNWSHGVYSARRWLRRGQPRRRAAAAAAGSQAMLPFCGYNMADYFSHWLNVGRRVPNPPRIFPELVQARRRRKVSVAGFRENARIRAWIVDRIHGRGFAVEARSVGCRATRTSTGGSGLFPGTLPELMSVGRDASAAEVRSHEELFDLFLDRIPKEFLFERELLRSRLWRSPERWELATED